MQSKIRFRDKLSYLDLAPSLLFACVCVQTAESHLGSVSGYSYDCDQLYCGRRRISEFFGLIAYFIGFIHFEPNCGFSNYLSRNSIFHITNR